MTCCQDLVEKLLEFRDGTLPPKEMKYLREHLHECTRCLYLLNGYDEVVEVVERLKPKNMPADLMSRLKQCMEEELRSDSAERAEGQHPEGKPPATPGA
jgi:anti-sigma factor RsiW